MVTRTPIPPLAGLRAFEAVARLMSFRLAAAELSVTASAVSHQVRSLEEALSVQLFERGPHGVTVTSAGQRFLPEVQAALDRLSLAVADLHKGRPNAPLTISMLPTFAVRWMIPRVADFKRKHPEIEVRLDASMEVASFTGSDVDLAIRYGEGRWPGLHCEPLIAERLIPVCSPALMDGPRPLKTPADLSHHVLLRNDAHPEDWPLWLKAARLKGIDLDRGPSFGYSELLLRAAAEGLGVAVARQHLVEAELKAGSLVAPFDITHDVGIRYWFVCPPRALDDPRVATFRAWLLAEAGPAQPAGSGTIAAEA